MFYNVENLFDIYDDTLKNDNEFLPNGIRHWTDKRFKNKINNLYKTIVITGGWSPPEIVGLCEVENYFVLNELVYNTPFSKFQYKIIHQDSPDERGIDVAMIYNSQQFNVLNKKFIKINLPSHSNENTRDILYVKGVVRKTDTLHIFINHWPSRRGGELQSEFKRIHVSQILKLKTDSIFRTNPEAKIILMGDFNDNATNKSLELLCENYGIIQYQSNELYNLSYDLLNQGKGTYKYQGIWLLYDQFIVSGSLMNNNYKLFCEQMNICEFEFLFEEDETYSGRKPRRTYLGYKYNNGFSDHLPVFLDIYFKK